MKPSDKIGMKVEIKEIIKKSYKPSLADIIDQIGFGDNLIFTCLKELMDIGAIEKNTQGLHTYYTLKNEHK